MPPRFGSILHRLRGLLLGAGWSAGVLWFWLGSNDVFEGPKIQAALVYALALAACSWPLLARRLPQAWASRRMYLSIGGLLVLATLASWLGAWFCLPGNLALPMERSVPLLVAAFSALVFLLEDAPERRRALFLFLCAHCLLLFYGVIQILDQVGFQALHQSVDLIRWVRFGQTRVYSTMGNPDYMAAHLTLLLSLWLGLGWRRLDPRGPAQVAALALALVPMALVPPIYGWAMLGAFLAAMGPWLLTCAGLFVLCRMLSPRACWGFLLSLISLLVLLAQGRGAWLAYGVSAAVMAGAGFALQGRAFFSPRRHVLRWPLGAALAGLLAWGLLLGARASRPEAAWANQGPVAGVLQTLDAATGRLVHIFDKADAAQVVRRLYWKAALDMGLDHPILGVGYGNHAMFTARYQSRVWKAWDAAGDSRAALVEPHVELYAHNDYLQNFAETGLLGLAAFLIFWGALLWKSWGLARESSRSDNVRRMELALGLMGLGAAFLVNALTNFPWRVLATQQLSWLAFALLAVEAAPVATAAPLTAATQGAAAEPARAAAQGTAAATQPARSNHWTPAPWSLALGAALAFGLALIPVRWFEASLLFKEGNARKDDPSPQVQVQGIPFYEAAVRAGLSGTQRVELGLYLGSLYNVERRPDLAAAMFQTCTRYYPDYLEAWYNLGYTLQNDYATSRLEADRQGALAAYARVLDVDPRNTNALNNSGNLAYGAGDFEGARKIFEQLLRYKPDSMEAHYNLAAVWVRKGDAPAARAELQKVLALKPDFDPARKLLQALARFR
jgi:tetratricopeptide (TPR) repeat protein